MSNPTHEIHNHFTSPPYTFIELKNVPGAHVVLTSTEVMGGPLRQAQFFTTTKFADANPKLIQALRDPTKEAHALIRSVTTAAAEIYKGVTRDNTTVQALLAWHKPPRLLAPTLPRHDTT